MKPAKRNMIKVSGSKAKTSFGAKALKVGMGVAKRLGPVGMTAAAGGAIAGSVYASKKKKKKKNGNKA
jgi:hypothetical protein